MPRNKLSTCSATTWLGRRVSPLGLSFPLCSLNERRQQHSYRIANKERSETGPRVQRNNEFIAVETFEFFQHARVSSIIGGEYRARRGGIECFMMAWLGGSDVPWRGRICPGYQASVQEPAVNTTLFVGALIKLAMVAVPCVAALWSRCRVGLDRSSPAGSATMILVGPSLTTQPPMARGWRSIGIRWAPSETPLSL